MTRGLTITKQVHFRHGRGGRKMIREGKEPKREPLRRVPRLSRLMALAIHMQDLAQLAHVSRARITQIMNLLNLAPDIQQEILFLPPTDGGRSPIRERMVRPIAALIDWRKQRRMWRELKSAGQQESER